MSRAGSAVIKAASNRWNVVTSAHDGLTFDLGPAAPESAVGTLTIQFLMDVAWVGSFVVMGVLQGVAADQANLPFMPIPYRRVNLNNVASDYLLVSDQITGAAIIQVPANGMCVGLTVGCSAGTCSVCSWTMSGPSSV